MSVSVENLKKPASRQQAILIIDDEPINLGVMVDYLEERDFETLIARSGQSGLKKARFARPDLILLDIRMPGMDGFETCRHLKSNEITRDIPVIFMTALSETADKIKGFRLGAVDYITKPFQKEEALARVATHLRVRELTERLKQKVQERTHKLAQLNRQLQQEIAERKEAETVLRDSEQKFRSYVEQSYDGIVLFDSAAKIIEWNRSQEKITYLKREEVLGQPVWDIQFQLLTDEEKEKAGAYKRLKRSALNFLRTGRTPWLNQPIKFEIQRPDGTRRMVQILAFPIETSRDLLFGSVTRDITEQVRLEEQYRQAQKMEAIGHLTGGIAHDFNNLLTAINGFAELMQRRLPLESPFQRPTAQILRAGRRAADLIQQLMAFSRKQIIQPKVLNLNEIVTNVDRMLRRIIGEDVQLETLLAAELWPVEVDPTQLEQVIVNLAVNARDAMPDGGRLIIETANLTLDDNQTAKHLEMEPGNYVLLAISDTGGGISKEVQEHLFEPFFTTKEKDKGTGLGLATVYGIVRQNDGHISVYSEKAKGTTFKIYLPKKEGATLSTSQQNQNQQHPKGTETVLLVEDDVTVRELTSTLLRQLGYIVLEAGNGLEALQIAREEQRTIHLVLTDVVMPQMNGKVLAQQLAALHPEIKILFASGYTDNVIAHHGVLDPGVAFIQKPFAVAALASKVREVLDGS